MKIENLNLSALKYFLDAVELNSITRSSVKNNISRPAVSQAIRRLEEWHGHNLLVHEKRLFELTTKGRIFYQIAKNNYEKLEAGFKKKHEHDDVLKIGSSGSLVDIVFPMLNSYLKKVANPTIKIGTSGQLLKLLDKEKIRIAFLVTENKVADYNYIKVYSGEFELRSKSGSFEDTLVTTESRPEVDSFISYMIGQKIKFKNHIIVESWTNSNRLAEIMNCVCLVPDYISKGRLKSIPLKGWRHPFDAYAVSTKTTVLNKIENQILNNFSSV